MQARVIANVDVSYLDSLLFGEDGLVVPISSKDLKEVPQDHLSLWCVQNAVYQIPTLELIEWLAGKIEGHRAIEIGSGECGVGRALGIPSTDSFIQTTPELIEYYNNLGQAPTIPPSYVERLDAIEAMEKYSPDIVIGCYITQKYQDGDVHGSVFGPDELEIIRRAKYIHVGNVNVHGMKRILVYPHMEYKFDWLRSRGFNQDLNVIYEWEVL